MSITIRCECGKVFSMGDDYAGMKVKCPACGGIVQAVAAATLSDVALDLAPPPSLEVRLPTQLPAKLQNPNLPPLWLTMSAEGADINADFAVESVFQAFAESFAKKLKGKYNVQLAAPVAGTSGAVVNVARIDKGSRFMRYFLGIFAGGTTLEIEGQAITASGQGIPFKHTHKGRGGLFGGSSEGLLKTSAKYLGTKVAKAALKSARS